MPYRTLFILLLAFVQPVMAQDGSADRSIDREAGRQSGRKSEADPQPQFHPKVRGFDEFYGFLAGAHSFLPVKRPEQIFSTIMRGNEPVKEPRYLTDAIARETVNFIDQHASKPFFAYVPFNAVHTPIEATKKYQDRFPNIKNAKRRDYYAMTSALDDAVGAIVAALNPRCHVRHGPANPSDARSPSTVRHMINI